MADAPDTAVSILQRPPRRLLTGFALLVSRQFIEPLAGKRLAAVLSWVSLPVQLAILMLSRSYAVCLGRDAIAVIRPPHRRSWTVAGLLEVLGWFVLIDVVVTWLSVFVPVAWWLVAVW